MPIVVGTAGWTIARDQADSFDSNGTSLQRYASRFRVVEINSSFHRSHRDTTWRRWREDVPDGFKFSVKVPKSITHVKKLRDCEELVIQFLSEVEHLQDKLGVLLVQLPPSLEFDAELCAKFFDLLESQTLPPIVCEPRHPNWFTDGANSFLNDRRVARVAADPAITAEAAIPGGWKGLAYVRLHGSPVIYRSSYADKITDIASGLLDLAQEIDVWCIFDNTASSAALRDARALEDVISGSR